MLVILPIFYGITVFLFSLLMFFFQGSPADIAARSTFFYGATKAIGYLFIFL